MAADVYITDNSPEFRREMSSRISAALEKCGLVAEGYAKRLCPVDTGNLRNSITHTQSGNTEYIGTNVEYAPYVEMGTTRTRAQPYLMPAVVNHADQYKRIVKESLNG